MIIAPSILLNNTLINSFLTSYRVATTKIYKPHHVNNIQTTNMEREEKDVEGGKLVVYTVCVCTILISIPKASKVFWRSHADITAHMLSSLSLCTFVYPFLSIPSKLHRFSLCHSFDFVILRQTEKLYHKREKNVCPSWSSM